MCVGLNALPDKHVRARFTWSVSVSQGPLIAYPGDKAYGYTAQGDTVRGQGLQSARHAHTWAHIHAQHCELSHTRVERYHLP